MEKMKIERKILTIEEAEMQKNQLIDEIISFCYKYEIFTGKINADEMKELLVTIGLNDFEFVENMINTIYIKTKTCENLDYERLERTKSIIVELEKIRFDLEYLK